MPNYLWVGMYEHQPERHSSCLLLTYETDATAFGNLYTLVGLPPHCSAQEMRSMQLIDTEDDSPLFASRLLLGTISDIVVAVLNDYVNEAAALLNDGHDHEDWILLIVRSFEDSRFLPRGSVARAQAALAGSHRHM